MLEKLSRLYNTLITIETKGESTKTMADCLRYTEQMMLEEKSKQAAEDANNIREKETA